MVFISAGSGEIEWKNFRTKITANDCFFIMPSVWHRYRPDRIEGWTEHWIELRGPMLEEWLANETLDPERLHFKIADASRVKEFFEIMHSLAAEKPSGYGMVMAGTAFALLAEGLRHASASVQRKNRIGISRLVRRAQRSLRGAHEGEPSISDLARRLGVSYPTLLRHFRNETGLKPKEYFDQIRMARAERLLAVEDLEIKEVASMLHFHSPFHFSARFKKSYGCSPSVWRQNFIAQAPASSRAIS